jgi:hypothetical protein
MRVESPQNTGEAVMRGACLARVDGEFTQFSGSKYSVAILTLVPYKNAVKLYPSAAAQRFPEDRVVWSPALNWKIRKVIEPI